MDFFSVFITDIVVSLLSALRYAALTGVDFKSVNSWQYICAIIFGLLFGLLGYFSFLREGYGASLFVSFAVSFLGSSIGLEIHRFIARIFFSHR